MNIEEINILFFLTNILAIIYGHLIHMLKNGRLHHFILHLIFLVCSLSLYIYITKIYRYSIENNYDTANQYYLIFNVFYILIYFIIIIYSCKDSAVD